MTPQLSPMANATRWVSNITTVTIEMVLPGILGGYVDRYLGLSGVFVLLGFVVGLPLGMWHLIQMTKVKKPEKNSD